MVVQAVSLDNVPIITFDQGEVRVYRDESHQLTLDDMRQANIQAQFEPLQGNLGLGYIPDTVWLHLSLTRLNSQSSSRWLEVLPATLDQIDLYHIDPKGQIDHRKAGDLAPQSAKEKAYRGNLFKLEFEPGQHELYIRLKTSDSMIAILKLWQPNAFSSHLLNSYLAFGLYYSVVIVIVFFALISWLISRRPIFIVYAAYLTFISIQWLAINGLIAEFIFPEKPLQTNLILVMSLPLTIIMGFIFFPMLFEYSRYHKYLHRFCQIGALLGIATLISIPLGYYAYLAPLLLLIGVISLFTAPWPMYRLWRTQEYWNRALVLSYSLFTILITLNAMGTLGLIPFKESFTYVSMASTLIEVFVMYLVIMLHYTRMGYEHDKSLYQAAMMKKEVEFEQKHYAEQNQLLAMITHEIRTPIAVINASNESLQIIDERTSSKKDRALRYDRINNAVMRIDMVMRMAITQTENDGFSFEETSVDLIDLTYDVIGLGGVEAEQRVVFNDLEVNYIVSADHDLLRVALFNLLSNSLKYSPKGSLIHINMQYADSKKGPRVNWIVDDKGPGIPEGMEEKIFEKYQRGDERNNQPGMGLGLFLVAQITERHKGEVTVENIPSGGSRFCLSLPSHAVLDQ